MSVQSVASEAGLFYYLNMREFEREESRKKQRKSAQLTQRQKRTIRTYFEVYELQPFSLKKIKKKYCTPRVAIDDFDELFEFLVKLDITEMLKEKVSLDSSFKCVLYPNNYGWVSKGEDGHFRYFTRSKAGTISGLDILDIAEICTGLEPSGAINWLIKELNIKFMEGAWMNEQNQKYLDNLSMIHQFKKIAPDYPNLAAQLRPHLKLLETLNVIGNVNIKKEEFSVNTQNIFFAASSYLSTFTKEGSPSTINKILNLFAVLGLITKVAMADVPTPLLFESRRHADQKKVGNVVNFFTIPYLRDVLESAELVAEVLNNNKVTYSSISKDKIVNIFGENYASKIYVQEIKPSAPSAPSKLKSNSEIIKERILAQIEKRGYVTKSMIEKSRIGRLTPNEKANLFTVVILGMANDYEYVRPTKDLKEKFGLKKMEYILIKKEN